MKLGSISEKDQPSSSVLIIFKLLNLLVPSAHLFSLPIIARFQVSLLTFIAERVRSSVTRLFFRDLYLTTEYGRRWREM